MTFLKLFPSPKQLCYLVGNLIILSVVVFGYSHILYNGEDNVSLASTHPRQDGDDLQEKFQDFPWIDYAPTNYDPNTGQMPTDADIRADLEVLFASGYRGIVTYSSEGIFAQIPCIARDIGFEGVVMGIWNPSDEAETSAAVEALPCVDGYVVGNEGLTFGRYQFNDLEQAIVELRQETGKPVTTTEIYSLYLSEDYLNQEELLEVGDWIFPNVHPYWQGITDPVVAAAWTEERFDELQAIAPDDVFVVLKEVGLPSSGRSSLNEDQQAAYYYQLGGTDTQFVYFEAFDQPWKEENGVGGSWGLFTSERVPKVFTLNAPPPFYIYADAEAPQNHFVPEGFMGCWQGITMDEANEDDPHSGSSAILVSFGYEPTCGETRWGGVYWWDPPESSWCNEPGGFDLTGWTSVTFWARGEQGGEVVEFKVGGLSDPEGDTCGTIQRPVSTGETVLNAEWTQYTINLYGQDLSDVTGGFVWVTDSTEPITFYLDDIRFE